MATTTRREVELRINANDLSGKTLDQLLGSFDKLREAQEKFAKSGEGSQRSIRELKQDLADLQAIALELKSRAALVDQFRAMQEQATKAGSRVEAAKAALAKFNAEQKQGAELTKAQQGELRRLTREVEKSEKALASATTRTARLGEELAALGTADTAASRDALVKFSGELGSSLHGAENAIRRYDAVLRANTQKERDAAEEKRRLAKATAELKQAQDELARATAFNEQGRAALKAASQVAELSKDYGTLAQSSRKAGDSLRSILDPTRQAMTGLQGLEQTITGLNQRLTQATSSRELRDEVRRLRAEYTGLAADAGKAAASLADDIGQYRLAEQALGALRSQVTAAQQEVQRMAAQMAIAGEPSEKLATSLQEAQNRLRALVGNFDRQSLSLANLRQRLHDAGVETDRLTEAEQRLEGVARGVAAAQRHLGTTLRAQDDLEQAAAFNEQGRAALKAASSVAELSKDYDALAQSSRKAGDGIRAILDPSRQAMVGLQGLEQTITGLNQRLEQAASNGKLLEEVRRLRSEYTGLAADAGKAAASLVDDIGRYRQAEQGLGTLRAQVVAAQQAAKQLATQMALASQPSDKLANSLSNAQAKLRTLVTEYDRQAKALANLKRELRDAGVDVNQLAQAEARLETVAKGVTQAQERLGVAMARVGEGAKKGAQGLSLFEDKGRKTLSSAQRLRGEVLSLVSAYTGLFGAINLARSTVTAAVEREQSLRVLEILTGSTEAATAKFEELRATADRLGVSFQAVAKGYGQVAFSAKEAGLEGKRFDDFFVKALVTFKRLGLDANRTALAFNAIGQIFSKNQVTTEELKTQLGEHLPGILGITAEAARVAGEELAKMLEQGVLKGDALLAIFDKYIQKTNNIKAKTDSAVEALNRFDNALLELKYTLADTGFLKAFTAFLNEVTERVKKGEFDAAIEGIGKAFRFAMEMAKFLAEHIDLVAAGLALLAASKVLSFLFGLGKDLVEVAGGFGKLHAWLKGSSTAATVLRWAMLRLVPVLMAAGAVYWAKQQYEQSEKVRESVILLVAAVVEAGGAFKDLATADFSSLQQRLARLTDQGARVAAAFRNVPEGLGTRRVSGKVTPYQAPGAAPGTTTPTVTGENEEALQAQITAGAVKKAYEGIAKMRIASAKEAAKAIGDIEGELRQEYVETQELIDSIKDKEARRLAQMDFDKVIKAMAARKRKELANRFGRDERGDQREALEREEQQARRIKDQARFDTETLDQEYERGLKALRDYYEERRDLTLKGIEAEITAAKNSIDILKSDLKKDPQAAQRIEALKGRIEQLQLAEKAAVRDTTFEIEQGEKALRRHFDALQDELAVLQSGEMQNELREIQRFYEEQLLVLQKLKGAEYDRAKAIVDTTVQARVQLAAIKELERVSAHRDELGRARLEAAIFKGEVTPRQALQRESELNKQLIEDLNKRAFAYFKTGNAGVEAFQKLQREIEHLKAKTDLLKDEAVAGIFRDAVGAAFDAFRGDDPGLDRLKAAQEALIQFNRQQELGVALTEQQRAEYQRLQQEVDAAQKSLQSSTERALRSFSKSIAKSLVKSWTDEMSTALVKFLKESAVGNFVKGLFGNMFSGIGGLLGFKTGHTGTVVGRAAPTKRVNPFVFAGAPLYHSGGLPGLRRDEVPIIAKRGEEVLSRTDARNVLNGGRQQQTPGRLVVQLDPRSMHMTMREWLEREMATIGSTQ